MSEIYNGSFVLGDTSATVISAGPGIKIDDSQPGVIKVSNDETVLWENNGSFSAKGLSAAFSEPASGFERLMFVCGTDVHNYNCLQVEYHPGSACLNWTEFYSNTFRYWTTQLNLGENGMTAGAGYIVGWSYPNGTAFAKVGNTDWEHSYKGIKKVIGINRKQNGGN